MKPIHLVFVTLMLALFFAACASPVDPNSPPPIVYGEDVCARCGMIITDERFAAGAVVEVGEGRYEHRIFDDIGDMFVYFHDEGSDLQIITTFVHDYNTNAWINAEDATFVKAESLQSPMGYGLAAFAERSAAESQALSWAGEVLNFEQAQQFAQMKTTQHVHTH